jgi:hypothetical protein
VDLQPGHDLGGAVDDVEPGPRRAREVADVLAADQPVLAADAGGHRTGPVVELPALHDVAGGGEGRDRARVVVVQVAQHDVIDVLRTEPQLGEPLDGRAVERDPVEGHGPGGVDPGVDEDDVVGVRREPDVIGGGVGLARALVVTEEVLAPHAGPAREADGVHRERRCPAHEAVGLAAAGCDRGTGLPPRSSVGVR